MQNLTIDDNSRQQISEACKIAMDTLGSAIKGIYLYGSALQGGLRPLSDIDLLIVIDGFLREPERRKLFKDFLRISKYPGTSEKYRALEVTIVDLNAGVSNERQLQFGEWLRKDIESEIYESSVRDQDVLILLYTAQLKSLSLYGPSLDKLMQAIPFSEVRNAMLTTLDSWTGVDKIENDERNILLAVARILFSLEFKCIASKEEAADWAIKKMPNQYSEILSLARDEYLGGEVVMWDSRREEILEFIGYAKSLN